MMSDETNTIFQDYLAKHADDKPVNFAPLLENHPELKDSLQKKIKAYQKVMGLLSSENEFFPIQTLEGKTVGDFRIIREIGRGGMGVVFLAEQISLKRQVAIKILHSVTGGNEHSIGRFRRESAAIARLEHDNIIPIYEIGEQDGINYIVMQCVNGISLADVIKLRKAQNKIPSLEDIDKLRSEKSGNVTSLCGIYKNYIEFICSTINEICDAISYAHQKGIIHRDIKPSNILIKPNGKPILLDFGLSKDMHDVSMTLTGEYLGTPVYSSPEQLFGKSKDFNESADIYSLGVSLYELITGCLPFDGDSFPEIISNIKNKLPKTPKACCPTISNDLAAIISTASSPDPSDRYKSVKSFSDDLKAFLEFRPVLARPHGIIKRSYMYLRKNKLLAAGIFLSVCLVILVLYMTLISSSLQKARHQNKIFEALTFLDKGNRDMARHYFQEVLDKDPDNMKAYIELVHMRMMDGENTATLLAEVNKKLAVRPNDINLLEILGGIYIHDNKYQETKEVADKILSMDPDNYLAHLFLSEIMLYQDPNTDDTIKYVSEFNRLFPDNSLIVSSLAFRCYKEKRYDCAIEFMKKAAEVDPEKYLQHLGGFQAFVKDFEGAVNSFKQALKYKPNDADVHSNLAVWLAHMGKYDEALIHARKAVELKPENKDYEFALNVINRSSKSNWLTYKKQGIDLLKEKKYFDAIDPFKKALIFNENDDELYQLIGFSLGMITNYEEALGYLEKSYKTKPSKDKTKLINSIKAHLNALKIEGNAKK